MKRIRVVLLGAAGVVLAVAGLSALLFTLPGGRLDAGSSIGEMLEGPGAVQVLSHFQSGKTQIDTRKALTFVVLPKSALNAREREVQTQFCMLLLASMDYLPPGEVGARPDVLATYWPIVPAIPEDTIASMFAGRDCANLLMAYDFALARRLAANAGVQGYSGPFLITWPSAGPEGDKRRYPLLVDFSRADAEHANKALQYWFGQVRRRPELWTNSIREGTIRAELADAVNNTAGVILSVFTGKWDKITPAQAAAP